MSSYFIKDHNNSYASIIDRYKDIKVFAKVLMQLLR